MSRKGSSVLTIWHMRDYEKECNWAANRVECSLIWGLTGIVNPSTENIRSGSNRKGKVVAAKYELKRSGDQFMFNLKAANGEIILTSERYMAKSGAKNGIESVRKNSPLDARYDRRTAKDGSPYFVLKAANGEPIGTSEMYSSTGAMENGIESVKKNGPEATVSDLT